MSATLPRSTKKSKPAALSHSSAESKRCKKTFYGTGDGDRKIVRGQQKEAAPIATHPWSGAVDKLLSPLPPDIRYNIQRALGGFAEAVGRLFPQNNEGKMQVGRRGF